MTHPETAQQTDNILRTIAGKIEIVFTIPFGPAGMKVKLKPEGILLRCQMFQLSHVCLLPFTAVPPFISRTL